MPKSRIVFSFPLGIVFFLLIQFFSSGPALAVTPNLSSESDRPAWQEEITEEAEKVDPGSGISQEGLVAPSSGDVLSPLSQSKGALRSSSGVKHVVFLLHGLNDTSVSFDGFKAALEKEFGGQILVGNLSYPTSPVDCNLEGIDWKHPYHFAKIMKSKITNFYYQNAAKGLIDLQTPYSVIAHSQGGLVTMIYLNTCMRSDRTTGRPFCTYKEGAENYVSLSKPENTESFNGPSFQKLLKKRIASDQALFDSLTGREQRDFKRDVFFEQYPGCKEFYDHARELSSNHPAKRQFLEGNPAVPNIKNFISLGSPFWGSATANRGQSIKELLDASNLIDLGDFDTGIDNLDNLFALEQLMRLAIGSKGTAWQRMFLVNRNATREWEWQEDTQWQSPYPEGLKIYNISGDLYESYNWLQRTVGTPLTWFYRTKKFESDMIVGAPSARLDSIFNIENVDPEMPGFKGVTSVVDQYFATKMAHVPTLGHEGMANVTEDNYHNHPSFLVAKRVLQNSIQNKNGPILTRQERREFFAEDLENFNSEIKLVTPKGYHRHFSVLPEQVEIVPDYPESFEELQVSNSVYAVGHSPNNEAVRVKHHFYQTYFHLGKMAEDRNFFPEEQYKNEDSIALDAPTKNRLNYSFDIHGFHVKELSNFVSPSYTSYTEGYLTPYHPIPNNQVSGETKENSRIMGVFADTTSNPNQPQVKVIRLGKDFKLSVDIKDQSALSNFEASLIKNTRGDMGRCYVGSLGYKTPEFFRHQVVVDAFVYGADGKILTNPDGSLRKETIYKMINIEPSYVSAEKNSTGKALKLAEGLTGDELYEKYAPNKNYLFKDFLAEGGTKADQNLLQEGDMVEILGRYSIGFVDPHSQIGRNCNNDEIIWANAGLDHVDAQCAENGMNGNLDRYLVTSPKIRIADGLSQGRLKTTSPAPPTTVEVVNGFHKLEVDALGRIPGTRWVSVRDVDIFKENFPIDTQRFSMGVPGEMPEGTCLISPADLQMSYPAPEAILENYYELR